MGISVHEQCSLLDTIFNYILYFGPPGKYLYLSTKDRLSVGQWSRSQIVEFLYFFTGIFLKVQNIKYSQILYLIDYIAHGPKFPHKSRNSPKSAKKLLGFIVTPGEGINQILEWFRLWSGCKMLYMEQMKDPQTEH